MSKFSRTLVHGLSTLFFIGWSVDGGAGEAMVGHRTTFPVAVSRSADIPIRYSVPGSVVSDDRIELSSRVVGFIRNLDVREGQKVTKGDLLVQIDPTDVNEAIRIAQADVATARTDLADAEHDVGKYDTLAGQGWASTEVLRKARVRRDAARSALSKAEAAVAAAQAQKAYTTILSPVDGVVVVRQRHSGDMAVAGQPLLTIESREVLLFRIFVAESNLGRIVPAMTVTVRIDALDGRELVGTVKRIVPSGDPVTRRYQVDIDLPVEEAILPGMFGRAEIVLGTARSISIPRSARVERGGLGGTFVVGDDRIARFRWLRFGREWQDLVEVEAGLSEGEKVLARADDTVRDGIVVDIDGRTR
ncbi:efflux RND transporter periplasmic adaptor subunit [Pinisolibacter sp.]|uniref:efflux RND transporter periplasmic adaptor subunit n=1 Tax=Pinisolibacter sp. TaxID=2172024 RepID=UPI002FDD1F5C